MIETLECFFYLKVNDYQEIILLSKIGQIHNQNAKCLN